MNTDAYNARRAEKRRTPHVRARARVICRCVFSVLLVLFLFCHVVDVCCCYCWCYCCVCYMLCAFKIYLVFVLFKVRFYVAAEMTVPGIVAGRQCAGRTSGDMERTSACEIANARTMQKRWKAEQKLIRRTTRKAEEK